MHRNESKKKPSKSTPSIDYTRFPLYRLFKEGNLNKASEAIKWLVETSKKPGFDFNQVRFKKHPSSSYREMPFVKSETNELIAIPFLAYYARTPAEIDFFCQVIEAIPALSKWTESTSSTYEGFTLVHYAAFNTDTDISRLFITKLKECKHDIDRPESKSPLLVCSGGNRERQFSDAIRTLLDCGASLKARAIDDTKPIDCFYMNNDEEFYNLAIELGEKPNFNAILQASSFRGDLVTLKKLVTEHASEIDINYQGEDKSKATPLINASYKADVSVIRYLLEQKADPFRIYREDDENSNVLSMTLLQEQQEKKEEVIKVLFEQKGSSELIRMKPKEHNLLFTLIARHHSVDPSHSILEMFLKKIEEEKASDILKNPDMNILYFAIGTQTFSAIPILLRCPLLDVNETFQDKNPIWQFLQMECHDEPTLEAFINCNRMIIEPYGVIATAIQSKQNENLHFLIKRLEYNPSSLLTILIKRKIESIPFKTLEVIWNKIPEEYRPLEYNGYLQNSIVNNLQSFVTFLTSRLKSGYLSIEEGETCLGLANQPHISAGIAKQIRKLFPKENKKIENESSSAPDPETESTIHSKPSTGIGYLKKCFGEAKAKALQDEHKDATSVNYNKPPTLASFSVITTPSTNKSETTDTFFNGIDLFQLSESKLIPIRSDDHKAYALIPSGVELDQEGQKLIDTHFQTDLDSENSLRYAAGKNIGFKKLNGVKLNPSSIQFNNEEEIPLEAKRGELYEYVFGRTAARFVFVKKISDPKANASDTRRTVLFVLVGYTAEGFHKHEQEVPCVKLTVKLKENTPTPTPKKSS